MSCSGKAEVTSTSKVMGQQTSVQTLLPFETRNSTSPTAALYPGQAVETNVGPVPEN